VTREGIKSSAGLLLKVGNEVVGIMFVNYRSPQLFLDREKQIIETFANSAAIAIQDARQWENSKQAQDQLIQAEKMSAVGTLASRVAHELKNPLANILSSINLLELRLISPENLPTTLQQMKDEVHRAHSSVDGLLDLARPRDAVRGSVNALDVLNDMLDLLENQARLHHIEIDRQFSPLPVLQGNAGMLKRAFGNILKNAIEGMPDGGRLTVSAEADKTHVSVTIQDTGLGIASENILRVFEPFFSTKEASGGHGLGLADSYQTVHDDHRGDIRVASKEDQGSTFTVILPIEG
jgi:two-component system sensor histidine kinase AtoS